MNDYMYFPKPRQAEKLYVTNKSRLSDYEKILLASIQGVTAKNKPCVWIAGTGSSYDRWLDGLKKDYGVKTEDEPSVFALLEKLKQEIKGYILFDLSDHTSLNVATSLAGIKRAVLVDAHIEGKVRASGLELLFDARGLDDSWTYEHFKDKFGQGEELLNDRIMLEQRAIEGDERFYTLRDYAIFCNMVTVYQSTSPLMEKFLKLMKKDGIVLGWGDGDKYGEDNLGKICASNGMNRVASDWASNLTVLSSVKAGDRIEQHTGTEEGEPVTEKAHYVTFIWTDGDNIQWTNGFFSENQMFWASPARGKFNMGWGINNLLYETAPSTMKYYYDSASQKKNAEDYFVVGPHYTYAPYFRETLPSYTEHLNALMGRTGLKYVQINETDTMTEFPEAFDDYTEHENIKGLFYLEYRKYDWWNGKIVWSNGKPVVSARFALWDPLQMKDAAPEDVVRKLNAMPADPSSPEGYSFVTVHAWSGYTTETVYEITKRLNKNIRVVTPDEFMRRIISNKPGR